MVLHLRLGDVPGALADDDADFRFVVNRGGVSGVDDVGVVADERGRKFREQAHVFGRRRLADVTPVIQARGNHLLRLGRRQQFHFSQLDRPSGRLRVLEDVALQLANGLAFQDPPCDTAGRLVDFT